MKMVLIGSFLRGSAVLPFCPARLVDGRSMREHRRMLQRYASVILPAAVVVGILITQAYDAGWIEFWPARISN